MGRIMRARAAWRFSIAGVVAVAALGVFATIGAATSTIATLAMVDASKTDSEVSGAAAPGSVVKLRVEVSSNLGDRWRSTKWTVGAVSKCQNANRDGDDGRFVSPDNFTLPAAGTAQVVASVALYPNSDCSGSPSSTKSVTQTIGTRTENGPLTQACARRVVLVLDESGSIGQVQGGIDSVREGAKAFVNGLADTGSQLAVIEFNTAARTVPIAGSTYNDITPAYANGAFATYINGQGTTSSTRYNPRDYSGNAQYTNWQDGLLDTAALNPAPELVVFITDGDPTARNTSTGQEVGYPDGSYLVMNPAFSAANDLKGNSAKTRIFALGVGAAVSDAGSLTRLQAISGPTEFTGASSLAESDYALVDNFDNLGPALATIAASLCSVRVHVVKQVDELDGDGYLPANGWNFTGTVTVSGAAGNSFKWLAPGGVDGPPAAIPSRSGATTTVRGSDGRLDFVWLPAPTTLTSQIVVDETLKQGYEFVSVACAQGVPSAVTQTGRTASVTVSGLAVNEDATCTFRNRLIPAELTIAKVFEGGPVKVHLLLDSTIKTTGSTQTFSTGTLSVRPGLHQVSEQFVNQDFAALFDSSYVCVAGSTTVAQGKGTVVDGGVQAVAGQPVTCTFTNVKDLNGNISKTVLPAMVPEREAQVQFGVLVVNTSHGPATITSLRDDVFGNLDANSPPGDHSWISSGCTVGQQLAGFDGKPGGADTYKCAFTGRVTGSPGRPHSDTATVTLADATGETVDSSDDATVGFVDLLPAIDVQKSVDPTYVQDSGPVQYTIVITNTSKVDPLRVDQLDDNVYGDLVNGPNKATCDYGGDPAPLPFTLPVGESMRCTFSATVSQTVTDTVTASGTDDEGNRVIDGGSAIVTVGKTPQPLPSPPAPPVDPTGDPQADLEVIKTQPATAYVGIGLSAWTTDIRVVNNGSDPASDTTLDDPAPANSRFLVIVHQPSQGTCAIQDSGRKLHCGFGTLAGGHSVAVRVLVGVRGGAGDQIHNTATAGCTASGAQTVCAAVGDASTRLLAGTALPCPTITPSRASLFADGDSGTLVLLVRRSGLPVAGGRVVLLGPGIRAMVRTNGSGRATATVTPSGAGVLRVQLLSALPCPPRDISLVHGVVAVTG